MTAGNIVLTYFEPLLIAHSHDFLWHLGFHRRSNALKVHRLHPFIQRQQLVAVKVTKPWATTGTTLACLLFFIPSPKWHLDYGFDQLSDANIFDDFRYNCCTVEGVLSQRQSSQNVMTVLTHCCCLFVCRWYRFPRTQWSECVKSTILAIVIDTPQLFTASVRPTKFLSHLTVATVHTL